MILKLHYIKKGSEKLTFCWKTFEKKIVTCRLICDFFFLQQHLQFTYSVVVNNLWEPSCKTHSSFSFLP